MEGIRKIDKTGRTINSACVRHSAVRMSDAEEAVTPVGALTGSYTAAPWPHLEYHRHAAGASDHKCHVKADVCTCDDLQGDGVQHTGTSSHSQRPITLRPAPR